MQQSGGLEMTRLNWDDLDCEGMTLFVRYFVFLTDEQDSR